MYSWLDFALFAIHCTKETIGTRYVENKAAVTINTILLSLWYYSGCPKLSKLYMFPKACYQGIGILFSKLQ